MARKPKAHPEGGDSITAAAPMAPVAEFAPALAAAAASPVSPEGVKVMLLCQSVFLPRDPLQADWRGSADTIKYQGEKDGRRARLTVHPSLAEFLQERKQAETLD
jgi:hypothetical protein